MLPGIVPAVGIFPCRGFLIPCHITGSCSVRFFMSSSFLFLLAPLLSKNRPRQTGRFAPAWLAGLLSFFRFLLICYLLLGQISSEDSSWILVILSNSTLSNVCFTVNVYSFAHSLQIYEVFMGGPAIPGRFVGVFFPFGIFCVRGDRVKENKQAER